MAQSCPGRDTTTLNASEALQVKGQKAAFFLIGGSNFSAAPCRNPLAAIGKQDADGIHNGGRFEP